MAMGKILLADDVQLFLELEKSFFKREDVDVKVVRSGTEVLQSLACEVPALIFLDLHVPGMNGDECCRVSSPGGCRPSSR
jgi:CheY-like chemotaxis protein